MKTKDKKIVKAYVEAESYQAFRVKALNEGKTIQQIIYDFVKEYIKK